MKKQRLLQRKKMKILVFIQEMNYFYCSGASLKHWYFCRKEKWEWIIWVGSKDFVCKTHYEWFKCKSFIELEVYKKIIKVAVVNHLWIYDIQWYSSSNSSNNNNNQVKSNQIYST